MCSLCFECVFLPATCAQWEFNGTSYLLSYKPWAVYLMSLMIFQDMRCAFKVICEICQQSCKGCLYLLTIRCYCQARFVRAWLCALTRCIWLSKFIRNLPTLANFQIRVKPSLKHKNVRNTPLRQTNGLPRQVFGLCQSQQHMLFCLRRRFRLSCFLQFAPLIPS